MKLNKLSLVFVFLLSLSLFSCSDDDKQADPNYVSFENKTLAIGFSEGEQAAKPVKVYTSNVTGADRVFKLEVVTAGTTADAANYTLPATVTVPANSNMGEFMLNYNNVDLAAGEKKLIVRFVPEAGVSVGNNIAISLRQVCNLNTVVFNLTLDAYGSETTWELYDSNSQVLFSGGPYTDGGTAPAQTWCLPNGDYTFLINDSYGDGIAPSGSYKLTRVFSDGSPSVILAQGSAFAQFETKTFTLN